MTAVASGTPLSLCRLMVEAARQEADLWESIPGWWARRQARAARRSERLWAERAQAAEEGRERAGWGSVRINLDDTSDASVTGPYCSDLWLDVSRLTVLLARELVDLDRQTGISLAAWPTAARLVGTLEAAGQLWNVRPGDPDPWSGDYELCEAVDGDAGPMCTAPAGHDGPHVAVGGTHVVAVWEVL